MSRKPTKATPAVAEKAAVGGKKKVRVLVTGVYGVCNTIAELSEDVLDDAIKAGEVDADPAAVAAVG